jgi:photosystem II stability/assembly factor-like uncharacterized protein
MISFPFLRKLTLFCGLIVSTATAQSLDNRVFGDLKARHLGPSIMSGRISCLTGVEKKPAVIYVGTAGGGVWKSLDHCVSFKPVFDKHNASIGAIQIDQSHPDTIWVGTGESWVRNSVSVGDGIYRSIDGGESWTKMGLEKSERISKIIIHPTDKNTLYVAVPGPLFADSEERGLYKTTDGGKTWNKIWHVGPATGCADVVIDPANPDVLLATAWDFRRKPYSFHSGGKNSGIYKSVDAGKTWKRITSNMPTGDLGRIDLAMTPADPNLVYATIESAQSAFYRSKDKGETWEKMGTNTNIIERPFYFSRLIADPKDPNRVYRCGFTMIITTDGGKSFNSLRGAAHGDHHDLWINPNNPENIIMATDGGVYVSHNRGAAFAFSRNLPVGQFYHVNFDLEENYNVYGGLQDNGSWMGPSRTSTFSIANRHWNTVGYGDGFWVVPDPSDNNYVYWESQGGELQRYFKPAKTSKNVKPLEEAGLPRYRYNWNSPIAISPSNKQKLYYGAQYLFLSLDKGESWKRISPDLTTNDPLKQKQSESGGLTADNSSAENHCTIFSICESPLNENVIWVGTDDGNLQLTKDGGKSWSNLSRNITGIPSGSWVSSIEASRFEAGVAYVTLDGHMNGDMNAYVLKTNDFGATWNRLGAEPIKGYCHVVKEDLVNPELLFTGTEFGLFVSTDGGKNWAKMDHNNNVPFCAIRDLKIHPKTSDLIMATHGRGIFILDNIAPLRELSKIEATGKMHVFTPAPYFYPEQGFDFIDFNDDEFQAPNPKSSFSIMYFLPKKHMGGDFFVELLDTDNKVISRQTAGKRKGINILEVPIQQKPPKMPTGANLAFAGFIGAPLKDGDYKLRMVKDADTLYTVLNLIPNPKSIHSAADKSLRHETIARLFKLCNDFTYTVNAAVDLGKQARALANDQSISSKTKTKLLQFADETDQIRKKVVNLKEGMVNDGGEYLRDQLSSLYGSVVQYTGKPSQTQLDRTSTFEKDVPALETELMNLTNRVLPALNKELIAAGKTDLKRMSRTVFDNSKD